ncbi:MAG: bifunctional shikimate kinase/3-dehydroquinate synthase, partial [Candidatus Dormibacteria bacterium]
MSAVRRVALVGLPGAGKSAIGVELARRLGWRSVDLDAEIADDAGASAPDILRREGEAAFRTLELSALRRAFAIAEPAVIACGGGVMTQPEARTLLLSAALVVWLDAPDAVLLQRLGGAADRPLLEGDPAARLRDLRSARRATYAPAHLRVDATAAIEPVARALADRITKSVRVDLAARSYHAEIGPGALSLVAAHVPATAAHVAVIADRRVSAATRALVSALRRDGRRVTRLGLVGGEPLKTWSVTGRLLQRLSRAGLRRSDCIVAVGGGALGDVAGFVAATYMRGVAWINVPTTLLAMVDSALGGKTGVNLPQGKNLAGAFWQPRAVVCDTTLLGTLADRAYRSAFAEIVKYCMISDDGLVTVLDRDLERLLARDADVLADTVRRSLDIKADVIGGDERESGTRAVLNYGHTVGHAIEAQTQYRLTHG